MKKQGGGVILNCGSINGVIGCGADSYSATKGGMIALTRALAVDNGKYNIRVNTVSPAATRTPMISELLDENKEFLEHWSNMPVRGIIEPEDVANAALFLVSDESRFITGQNLMVDGGCSIM
jgi:NAD(P)-dependent dehydrogenase (short-subunit alcohol dehydrogenase family)